MKEFIDKLISRLDRLIVLSLDKWDGGASENAYKICKDIIQEEVTKYNNGWIPVSDRLPNKEEYLKNDGRFIVTDGNRCYQAYLDIYEKQCFGIPRLDGFRKDKCVIAWQPLPAPYEPKGENSK